MRKLVFLFALTFALPCWAGVTYTAVTRTILGSKNSTGDFRVQGWISGKHARMDLLQSELPLLESGSFMVTSDGGDTVYLVSPKDKTYERWDMNSMVSGMADLMRSMRGEMRVKFEEPKVEKLLEENGPKMQGMPTRHFRYRTSYKASIDMLDSETISTVMEEDIWTTTAITEPGVKLFLDRRASTGDAQLDHILEKEMSKVPGFPMKRVTNTTTQTKKGTTVNRAEMEIVEVKSLEIPEAKFRVPTGFAEMDPNESGMDRALHKLQKDKQR